MRFKHQGFTLTELLVVIAIMAIMAAIAFPNMSQWIASRRAAAQAEQISNLLRFARSEAVRLNTTVYVCPAQIKADGNPDNYCNTSYAESGMAAFADTDKNGMYTRGTDIDLRTVILNAAGENKASYKFETYDFPGKKLNENRVWAFYPNGTFGHAAAANGTFTVGSGFVKIAVTDANAQTEAAKAGRTSVLLIDSSGRVMVCSSKNIGSNKNTTVAKLCQYETQAAQP